MLASYIACGTPSFSVEGSGMEGNSCLETTLLQASAPCLSQIRRMPHPPRKEMRVLMVEPTGGSKSQRHN